MRTLLEHSVMSPEKALTRRQVIGGTASLLGLTSIGGHRVAAHQASPTTSSTRIVETIHGPVEVPAHPQRIVAITYIASIAVVELGTMPVGITRWVPDLPPDFPELSDVAIIENEAYELDIEAIIALQPDLILGADVVEVADQGTPYEVLSRIAPTALFEWTSGGANWEVQAAGCAEALGRTAEFAALRDAYEEEAMRIKTSYADLLADLTVDFIDAGDSEWYLHGPASTHCKVAIDAGVHLGAGADQEETFTGFSFEQLNMLVDTGALVARGGAISSLDALYAIPTFASLPAVRANHVMASDYFYTASYAQSNALLSELESGLQAL